MKVLLTSYSPSWPRRFETEKLLLQQHISLPVKIEHIGSTSIVGLCAKPIIDILIGVADGSQLDIPVPEIQDLGYEYISRYEDEMPYRRFFIKENKNVRTHHIHMVAHKSTFWIRHLQFRDYLRAHSEIAEEYAALKRQLAERDWESVNDYADAKTDFIRRIEVAAKNFTVKQY
jgi:GrpB-like predicted nucleotidyltransferase (UPF0157 family)